MIISGIHSESLRITVTGWLNRLSTKSRIRETVLLFTTLLLPVLSHAQPVMPQDNSDLDRILSRLKTVELFTWRCEQASCPVISCSEAEKYYQTLRTAEVYLDRTVRWLYRYNHRQMAAFENLVGNSMHTAERLADVQWALGVHQYLHRFGSLLLDIASLKSSLDEALDETTPIKEMDKGKIAMNLYGFYETIKDFESLKSAAVEGWAGREPSQPVSNITGWFFEDKETVNDMVSHANDILDIIDAVENGENWGSTAATARVAVGQIAGRLLKSYSQSKIEERKNKIREYMRDLQEEQEVQKLSFEDLGRIQVRRFMAEDALALVKRLIIAEGNAGGYTRCFLKVCGVPPRAEQNVPDIPDFINTRVMYADPALDPPRDYEQQGIGRALQYLNPRLEQLSQDLDNLPEMEWADPASLTPAKNIYAEGEDMEVRFTAPACWPDDAWLGLVPSGVQHGDMETNKHSVVTGSYHSLRGRESGKITLTAPEEPGRYDIRLHNSGTGGREETFVSIRVGSTDSGNEESSDDLKTSMHTSSSRTIGPRALEEAKRNPALKLEGNWYVRWEGSPEGEVQEAMATFVRGVDFGRDCGEGNPGQKDCFFQVIRKSGERWRADGTAYYIDENGNKKWTQSFIDKVDVSPLSTAEIDYFTGVFGGGAVGGVEVLSLNGKNRLNGRWNYRNSDTGGSTSWRRAIPAVERAVFEVETGDKGKSTVTVPGEKVARVELRKYDSGSLRDHTITIRILGENLWGVHYPWIPRNSGLKFEIGQWGAYICSDGDQAFKYNFSSNWVLCRRNFGGVSGLWFQLEVDPDVKPGRKIFYLDGIAIPFDLRFVE